MQIETLSQRWRKARSLNQISNGFVSKVPTKTEPIGDAGTATGASVIELGRPQADAPAQNLVLVSPYAIGSNNNTFSMRAIGWTVYGVNPDTWNWVPVVLLEVLCTISSSCPGAGGDLLATELFADTIAVVGTTGNTQSYEIVSPAADVIAHLVLDMKGFQKLELSFTTGASVTSCNALLKMY